MCVCFFFIPHNKLRAAGFVRSTTVCSTTFRLGLFLQLLNLQTAVTAHQTAAQVEVAYLLFSVLRDEGFIHLSIDLSISPRLRVDVGIVYFTATIPLATT